VTALWQAAVDASPPLARWLERPGARLRIGRLPRAAWPIVAASIARDLTARGRPVLVLVPAPERFAGELRPWLAGRPPIHVFAEVTVSFLDRPPAYDEAVSLRLEALAALAGAGRDPMIVVSSRRAALRATISPADLAAATSLVAAARSGRHLLTPLTLKRWGGRGADRRCQRHPGGERLPVIA